MKTEYYKSFLSARTFQTKSLRSTWETPGGSSSSICRQSLTASYGGVRDKMSLSIAPPWHHTFLPVHEIFRK